MSRLSEIMGISKKGITQLGAYILIIAIAVGGFQLMQNQQNETTSQFCASGNRSRATLRQLVNSVADLGTGIIRPPSRVPNRPVPPLNESQRDTLQQFEQFRSKQLRLIQAPKVCN